MLQIWISPKQRKCHWRPDSYNNHQSWKNMHLSHRSYSFLHGSHFHSGDTTREALPQALLADHKGISGIFGKSDSEVQTILRPYKTIANSVANINPLVTPRMFKDVAQKQCLSWVSHTYRAYCPFIYISFLSL